MTFTVLTSRHERVRIDADSALDLRWIRERELPAVEEEREDERVWE
jgi:hypothetical protein